MGAVTLESSMACSELITASIKGRSGWYFSRCTFATRPAKLILMRSFQNYFKTVGGGFLRAPLFALQKYWRQFCLRAVTCIYIQYETVPVKLTSNFKASQFKELSVDKTAELVRTDG